MHTGAGERRLLRELQSGQTKTKRERVREFTTNKRDDHVNLEPIRVKIIFHENRHSKKDIAGIRTSKRKEIVRN
jgi:hypothetical protein